MLFNIDNVDTRNCNFQLRLYVVKSELYSKHGPLLIVKIRGTWIYISMMDHSFHKQTASTKRKFSKFLAQKTFTFQEYSLFLPVFSTLTIVYAFVLNIN